MRKRSKKPVSVTTVTSNVTVIYELEEPKQDFKNMDKK